MIKHLIEEVVGLFVELIKKEEIWVILFITGFGAVIFSRSFELPELLPALINFLALTWWLWLFLILWPVFHSLLLFWRQSKHKEEMKYAVFEIMIPRETTTSPKAMEQVLISLHALRSPAGNFFETYIDGQIVEDIALEIVSWGGEIHLYIRLPEKNRNVLESAFASYYSDVELIAIDDYTLRFPQTTRELYAGGREMWGTDINLAKEAAYPIKTYTDFESMGEAGKIDPISTLIEVLSRIKKPEIYCVQLLAVPKANDWRDEWEDFVTKLRTPETKKIKKGDREEEVPVERTPGQTNVLKAIENNLSKRAFDVIIRMLYIFPRELMSTSHAKGVGGAFNQYSALDLNAFRIAWGAGSAILKPWLKRTATGFTGKMSEARKQRRLYNYIQREIPLTSFMARLMTSTFYNWNFSYKFNTLSVDAIATIFHPPTAVVVTAPHMLKTPSHKSGPPAGLQIYGEEESIKKFVD